MAKGLPLRRELPGPVLDEIVQAVEEERAAVVEVTVSVDVKDEAMADLPDALRLRVILQPELDVDIVEATI